MADFGLAAQIGRGNAMPGAQQQDPQNRMMQMMQLQQLQQNMMLAREQEARQAQLFGPQLGSAQQNLENLRNQERREAELFDPRLQQARGAAEVTNAQLRQQKVQANVAEEGYNVKTRLLKLRSSMEPDVMMSPDFRKTLMRSDPELAIEIDRLISEGEKTRSEQQKAGYDRDTAKIAQQKAVVGSIANSLGGVVDQQTFSIVLNELEKVDPLATKLIGPRFNAESMRKLERRLRGLQNFELKQNERGEFERIDLDTGTSTVVGRASPFGSTMLAEPALGANADAATFNAARAAGAATPPYTPPGATPIIGGREAPASPELGPRAAAAAEKKAAELRVAKVEALPKVQSAYKATIDSIDKQLRAIEEIESRPIGTYFATGPIAGSSFNPARVLPGDILGVQGAQAQINNLKASGTLTALTELRRNSPTGSALGNSSDRDAQILEQSDSALSQAQNTDDFKKAVVNKKRDLLLAKRRLGEAYASDYGAPPKVEGGPLSKELVRSSDTSVLLPNGKTLDFPSKDAVDAYMKKAGM
jgi:hypothetical protein